jgi:hypothetical protein
MNSTKSDLYQIADTMHGRDVEALTFLNNNIYSSFNGRRPARCRLFGPYCGNYYVRKCKLFFKYGFLFSFIITLILIFILTLNNSIINYQHSLDEINHIDTNHNTTPMTLDDDYTTPLTLDDDDQILDVTLDDDDQILDVTLDDDDQILDEGDNNTTTTPLDDEDKILDEGDNNTTTTPLTLDGNNTIALDDKNLIDNVVVANSALGKQDVILANKTVIIDATRNYIIVKSF